MTSQLPHLDEGLIAAALKRVLGSKPESMRHLQTKDNRDVYEAGFSDGRQVVLKGELEAPANEQRLALEAWAMEQARACDVPAPALLGHDFSLASFPFRFLVMEKVRGTPLDLAGLTPAGQAEALRQSGRLLARLHRLRVTGYGLLNEEHFFETGQVAGRFARWAVPSTLRAEASLNALYGEGLLDVEEASGAMHLIEDEAATDVTEACLLHGDFSARQTYVDPSTAEVVAIIDFGDRMAGPPLWDLAGAWLGNSYLPGLNADATDHLIEGYDEETGGLTPRPRLRTYCLMRLLVLARLHHEAGRSADYAGVRLRLDALLEEAGRL